MTGIPCYICEKNLEIGTRTYCYMLCKESFCKEIDGLNHYEVDEASSYLNVCDACQQSYDIINKTSQVLRNLISSKDFKNSIPDNVSVLRSDYTCVMCRNEVPNGSFIFSVNRSIEVWNSADYLETLQTAIDLVLCDSCGSEVQIEKQLEKAVEIAICNAKSS